MLRIGLSASGKTINEDLFKQYSDAGITCMEVTPALMDAEKETLLEVKGWSEKYGVELWSFHLPFMPFDEIDLSNPELCDKTVDRYIEIIKNVAPLGVKLFVVHPSGEPIEEEDRPVRLETARKSLSRLADLAAEEGVTIAVEDIPRTCIGRTSSDILYILEGNEKLVACFDTNHILIEDNIEFIKKVGNKIKTLHVSDYDFINERHWLPGEGKNDWQGIYKALLEVGYTGPWLYEMGFKCPKTIIRPRDLTTEDFARNAKEIFENKPLTVFSTHKEKLGMWE